MAMTEEKLLELAASYPGQMKEILQGEGDAGLCEKLYLEYMDVYEQLLSMDFDKYADKVAKEYCILVDFLVDFYRKYNYKPNLKRSIKVLTKCKNIHKKLAEKDKKYLYELSGDYEAMGEIYEDIGNDIMVGIMYNKSDRILDAINK